MKPFLASFYSAFTGEALTPGVASFFKHLSWIGVGFVLSKAMAFLTTLSAARLLGPVEFGRVNLSVDVGTLLYAFGLWGTHSSIPKYGATLNDPQDFSAMSFSAMVLAFIATLIVTLVVIVAGRPLAQMMSVTLPMLHYGWAFAIGFTIFSSFTSMLQAVHKIKERSLLELTFAVCLASSFVAALICFGKSFKTLAGALAGGYLVTGCVAAFVARDLWSLRWSMTWFKKHLHYGTYGLGQSLSFFCLANLQRLLINAFISTREAGIYSAYNISSIAQAFYAANAISILLIPRSSSSRNRASLWKKISRGWLAASIPTFALIVLFQIVTLLCMGRDKFPIHPIQILVFASAAIAILIEVTLSSVLIAEGTRGAGFVLAISIAMGIVNFLLGILWVPAWAATGAALSVFVSYGLGFTWLWAGHRRYV